MNDLRLDSIKTTTRRDDADLKLVVPSKDRTEERLDNADDIIRTLRDQPDTGTLEACLKTLHDEPRIFDIRIPSPKSTQIANALARDIIPHYWRILRDGKEGTKTLRRKLIWCFRNTVGVGTLVLQLRELVEVQAVERHKQTIQDTLEALEATLRGVDTVRTIAEQIFKLIEKPTASQVAWDNFLPYLAGGKILSVAGAADIRLRGLEHYHQSWLSDGADYTRWLGRNIRTFGASSSTLGEFKIKSQAKLFTKALHLGYRDVLVETVFNGSLKGDSDQCQQDCSFLKGLKSTEIQEVSYALLRIGSKLSQGLPNEVFVKGLSGLLIRFSDAHAIIPSLLYSWLTDGLDHRVAVDIPVRRAVIAIISTHIDQLIEACESLLKRFGDKIYIQNAVTAQQEVHTQDLLLIIGHIQHRKPERVRQISKSGPYLNAISNRLAASSPRTTFLGMVLGTAVSKLVDSSDKRLKFEDERLVSEEGLWYQSLVSIYDEPGTLEDLSKATQTKPSASSKSRPRLKPQTPKSPKPPPSTARTKVSLIQEQSSPSQSSDSDLPTYAKPDSDPSDSEEDPTLINRSKPKAPVYIRDLLRGLQDTENYDVFSLALTSSADLIRRKAAFGSEVSAHAEQLATRLAGAHDNFNMEHFEEERIKGMIAVIAAQPEAMGKWFSASVFAGDYSISQRTSMLTAMTMAARELAGYREEDAAVTGAYKAISDTFPSAKQLPANLEAVYGGSPYGSTFSSKGLLDSDSPQAQPVSLVAEQMQSSFLTPIRASAVNTLTPGLSALKLTSVKEKSLASRTNNKTKRIDNRLAKILAENFFYPLASRFRLEISGSGSRSPFATSYLMAHFLRTLALLLAASGPNTLSLFSLVTEFLGLCLWAPVRGAAAKHMTVREAVLFCLMVLLDTAAGEDKKASERQLVGEHAQEILEVQAWCESVFEITPPKGDELEARIRQLSAGVLVRCGEVVERYKQEMMGELARFA